MALLTTEQIRQLRERMTESELLKRCRSAASLEMRGSSYSHEDRADCAAALMLAALDATAGLCPAKDDSRWTLTMQCGRARNFRRALDSERKRDQLAADIAADIAANSIDALMPDAHGLDPDASPSDPAVAAAQVTDLALTRLGYGDSAPVSVRTLIYRQLRRMDDASPALIAGELSIGEGTVDRRAQEGRKRIKRDYPHAIDFLRALIDAEPTASLAYSHDDLSRPAPTHGKTVAGRELRQRAAEWRTGTDAGDYAQRATSAEHAREVCEVTHQRPAPVKASKARARADKLAGGERQATADALRRLGLALTR